MYCCQLLYFSIWIWSDATHDSCDDFSQFFRVTENTRWPFNLFTLYHRAVIYCDGVEMHGKKMSSWGTVVVRIRPSSEATWLLPPTLLPFKCFVHPVDFCSVCVFWIVLISHLPSAGLCEESGSSPRLLCPRWSCSSTPAIRQSCRDSLYASSGEQLQDTVLLHTSGWVVGICLTANELSFGQSLPPTVIAQNTSVSCMMRWTANSVPSEIKRAFLQCRVDGLDEAYGK